jgi:predicted RNA-binding Zn-ribbon protein involved in translation (DUF1610 family)
MLKTCDQCEREFFARESKVRFCCPECNRQWWVQRRSRAMAMLAQAEKAEAEKERAA